MSENKNEIIDELLSETTLGIAGTSNTGMPVVENLLTVQDAGTSDNFSLSNPEVVNTPLKVDEANEQCVDMLSENITTASSEILPVALTVTDTISSNIADVNTGVTEERPPDNVLSSSTSTLHQSSENVMLKQTTVPDNNEKEDPNKDLNVNTENVSVSPKEIITTVETEKVSEENFSPKADHKLEGTKNILEDNKASNIPDNKNLDKDLMEKSNILESCNEPTKVQNESLAEVTKDETRNSENFDVDEKEQNVDENEAKTKTNEMPKFPTEQIEPMDTFDSQESLNLIIDETSNTSENKDDLSEISKTGDDTNMEVDLNKVTSPSIKETDNKNQEITDDNVNTAKEENTATEVQNTTKDDDVIPIEQPPVPIIEIDDEDDIDTTTSSQAVAKVTVEKEEKTPMELDDTTDILNSKNEEISSIEREKNSNTNDVSMLIQESEDTLLEVASEKTLDEVLKATESSIDGENFEDLGVEIFYNKECINYECPRKHKQYLKVPQFAFSYFKVTKKKFKVQYICGDCYDRALEMYEEFCGLLRAKQPLLLEKIPSGRQEFVEIIDSSDDEYNNDKPVEPTKPIFAENDLSLIEAELQNTIKAVLNKVQIQNQLTWSKTILSERLKRLEVETDFIDNELKALQKKADKMHEGLYSCPKIKIRQLQPLDLNSGKPVGFDQPLQKEIQPIPPVGEIERPPIQVNNIYYAVKNNPIASWVPCRVIEQVEGSVLSQKNIKHYKIKFIKNQIQMPKTVPAKYLAYYDPPSVRLPIGTRVIAYFDATSLARGREKINVQSAFYPGIIAEPLKPNNKFRYLIFYDDGYTQYVYHRDVRLVCHVSDCVWEDVHPASRDFIQKYLTQYSINRPMVQTQKGQSMNTESNGYWLHARVVDIDCSLVLMQFEGSKSHTEWIYRGSLRLGPVFKEYQKSLQKNTTVPVSRLPRRTEPFIRYTEDEENTSQQQAEKSNENSRAVARKTFGRPESMMNSGSSSSQQQQPQPTVKHLNNSTIYVEDENKPKGKVVYYTAKRNLPPRKYKHHTCSPSCLFEITHNLSAYSPLSKPLLSGWERFIIRQKIKRVVTYRAPCGKIMRNMKELHHYLRTTSNVLNVDNFDFSHETNCLAEYVIESAIVQKRDISGGQEKMAIPLVNYYDNTLPPECKYSAKVIPTEGVHINTDPAFLVGCDCEDDCIDKNKCACWQLTLAGAKYGNPNAAPEEVGYQYRRLLDHVPTGIYECNANCKCKSSCLNRVVQNSLTMKLQVFKTSNRGWGLRCINDIPRGSFVCVYAGHLLTEAKANEGGQDAGDEYFAELDYIEVAEQIKEGYESEVELPEPEEEDTYNPEGDDDEFTPSKSWMTRAKQRQTAIKTTRSSNQEEDSQERQVINFNPNADMNEDSSVRENSIRKLYGKDEACYVMDAKISGNLGRYFNHSCSPNMFVQNVFVETHDLRFPNVAFFSSCNIRAGTELTWNYNYEVGVVPGKVLYCQCGASNCRLRLL